LNSYPERPVDFDLLTLEMVQNVSRGMDNLHANFGASACDFVVDLWAKTRQNDVTL